MKPLSTFGESLCALLRVDIQIFLWEQNVNSAGVTITVPVYAFESVLDLMGFPPEGKHFSRAYLREFWAHQLSRFGEEVMEASVVEWLYKEVMEGRKGRKTGKARK